MRKFILALAIFVSLCVSGRAGVMLGTSNPPGTPLIMSAGTTSGPMLVSIVSDNPTLDIMSAWNFDFDNPPRLWSHWHSDLSGSSDWNSTEPAQLRLRRERSGDRGHQRREPVECQRLLRSWYRPRSSRSRFTGSEPAPDGFPGVLERIRVVRNLCTPGGGPDTMDRWQCHDTVLHQCAGRHGHGADR